MTAGIYKFLVSDYLNPALLPTGGARSGEIFIFAQSCIGVPIVPRTIVFELTILQAILVLFIQLWDNFSVSQAPDDEVT